MTSQFGVDIMHETIGGSSKSANFLAIVLFTQFAVYLSIFCDIPIARQVICFLYLSFLPGLVLVKLLRLNRLSTIETVLFSLGLSIALLMIIGLFLNYFLPLLGILYPLSLTPIIAAIGSFVLVGSAIDWARERKSTQSNQLTRENNKTSLKPMLCLILPALSIIGAFWANITGNSSLLLFTLFATAVAFGILALSTRMKLVRINEIFILAIALTLLFQGLLVSNYINGHDIHLEYYLFKQTQENAFWNSTAFSTDLIYGNYNSMASITILPTIYSEVLNLEATWVLKIVFPLLFAFVPLGLYQMWKTKLGAKTAFFSAFLLMSQFTFYMEMIGLARQMIAELFFVLLFIIIFSKNFDHKNIKACFIIFSFALVISHYSMAIIFLFFISFGWLFMYLSKKKCQNLSLPIVLLFFSLMFLWYIFASAAASFDTIILFVDWIYSGLGNFLDPASRGAGVLRGIGLEATQSYLQLMSRIVAYITQVFIVIGFFAAIVQRKKGTVDFDYISFASLSMVILSLTIILPNFADSLQITRFYHILLFFLAPFFLLGCQTLISFVVKNKKQIRTYTLATIILIAYFLFQTNFVYEVAGTESWSVPLSLYRMGATSYSMGYTHEQDVFGAYWLSENVVAKNVSIYADALSRNRILTSYAMIFRGEVEVLDTYIGTVDNKLIYLNLLNVVYDEFGYHGEETLNSSVIAPTLQKMNKIYTNGGSEVYIDRVFYKP